MRHVLRRMTTPERRIRSDCELRLGVVEARKRRAGVGTASSIIAAIREDDRTIWSVRAALGSDRWTVMRRRGLVMAEVAREAGEGADRFVSARDIPYPS